MPPQTVTVLSPLVRASYTPALGEGVSYNSTGTVAAQTLDGVQTIFYDPTFGLGDGPLFGGVVRRSSAARPVWVAAPFWFIRYSSPQSFCLVSNLVWLGGSLLEG